MHRQGEAAVPVLGITMGCPVGVGPEIILRFLASSRPEVGFQPVVLGDPGVLARCAEALGLEVPIVDWRPGRGTGFRPGTPWPGGPAAAVCGG